MSAALLDAAPAFSPADMESRSHRSTPPVGARFPRRVGLDTGATTTSDLTPSSAGAPVFPIGAKFPRRSAAEILRYLAELELRGGPVVSAASTYPAGARFPLR